MLQTREFVNNEQPIYKIGRTQQPLLKRFNQYPKGSLLIIHVNVKNSVLLEKKIISVFSNQFTCKKNLGHEYFEGDISKMKVALFEICCHEEETQNENENEVEKTQNENEVENVSGDGSKTPKPSFVLANIKEMVNTNNTGIDWVNNNYIVYKGDVMKEFVLEKTDKGIYRFDWNKVGDNWVLFDTMYEWYKNDGNTDSTTKFGKMLTNNNILTGTKKINGRARQVRIGLKRPNENDSEDDDDDDDSEDDDDDDDSEDICEIKKTFPNFNDDIVFDGTKQLVKFSTFDELNMKIDTIFINTYKSIDNYEIDPSYDLGTIGVNYIKKLLQNGCFNFDEICDLKDKPLMRKMHSCKKQIKNVMLYEYPEETPTKSTYDQIKIFFNDTKLTTINEKVYYADNITSDEDLYDNTSHQQWFDIYIKGEGKYQIILVKMKHFYIDIKLLRKLLPYKIKYNGDSKIGYIINRDNEIINTFNQDYEYIESHGIKSIDFDFKDNIKADYLFNDDNKPWENLKNTKQLFDRFTKYIRLHNITIKNITKTENLFNKILM
jgi:hypothetical protein